VREGAQASATRKRNPEKELTHTVTVREGKRKRKMAETQGQMGRAGNQVNSPPLWERGRTTNNPTEADAECRTKEDIKTHVIVRFNWIST
jgi:hypothetical protein